MDNNLLRNFKFLIPLSVCLLFSACSEEKDVATANSSISGIIGINTSTQIDSDINDINATNQANNSVAQAQAITNPVYLGGYVNVAGLGPEGQLFSSGDSDDYYTSHLLAGQTLQLKHGNSGSVRLTLSESNNAVAEKSIDTAGAGSTQLNLDVDQEGDYYIHVQAISGYSNYVLHITSSAPMPATPTNADDLKLDAEFVPGDIIVRFKSNIQLAGVSSLSAKESSARILQTVNTLGFRHKAGNPGRNILVSIAAEENRNKTFQALGLSPTQTSTKAKDKLQLKRDTLSVIRELRKRSDVIEARPNYIRHATATPDDTYYPLQWHYDMMKLEAAWDTSKGDNVIVAVIDTGVLLDHPDLVGKLVDGYDFIADNANSGDDEPGIDNNPYDVGDNPGASSFHGTHVAGTIGATSNNSLGVAGVGWNVKIMPLRVLGKEGGTDYDIEQAIRWASGADNDSNTIASTPADIINLSLGGPAPVNVVPEAFQIARNNGVIVVAAAGNSGPNLAVPYVSYPAALDGVVGVSAVNISKTITNYSNFGSFIDVAAPGGSFLTNDINNDGYDDGVLSLSARDDVNPIEFLLAFQVGTSMAAPHVAGMAALMKSVNPSMTPDQFDTWLQSGALTEDLGPNGWDQDYGHGLVDANKAVIYAQEQAGNINPPSPAQASIYPTTLNFGEYDTHLRFTLSNLGDEALSVTAPLRVSANVTWLEVSPIAVDQNGLGQYDVAVNRNNLNYGSYAASITVPTNAGDIALSVYMQIRDISVWDNAGIQYVTLINTQNGEKLTQAVSPKFGQYQFAFSNVASGNYVLRTNSDLDNDKLICDEQEACGQYPDVELESIVISKPGQRITVSNFHTDFASSSTDAATNNVLSTTVKHLLPLQ